MPDSAEVKAFKGLTTKALVIATVGLVFTALLWGDAERAGPWSGFRYSSSDVLYFWHWQVNPVLGAYGMAWVFMIVIAFINHGAKAGWWKTRFSGQEVALISVMIVLGGVFNGYYRGPFKEWFSEGAYVVRQPVGKQADLWKVAPPIFGPQDPGVWRFYTGIVGQPVKERTLMIPWVELAPMMIIAISFISSGMLCLVFASMLLRRLYCTVEYLPMPIAGITTDLINLTQTGSEKVRLFKSKPFLLGFLLCFIYMFPIHSLSFYQTLATGVAVPRQWGYLGGVLLYPYWDFTPNVWLAWVPLFISLIPWEIGWGLLLPANVLTSALIGWFAMFVIVPLALSPYLGPQPKGVYGAPLMHSYLDFHAIGFSYSAIFIGMLVAITFVPIIRNRRHMIPVFKALLSEPPEDFDPDKPISYRLTWLLTIGFGLLWYLIGTLVINIRFDALLLHSIMISILFIGGGRLVLETGGYYGNFSQSWMGGVGDYVGTVLLKLFNVVPSRGQVTNIVTTYYMNSSRMNMYGYHENIPWYSINAMKVAEHTKTKTSDILKVLAIGIIISMPLIAVFHFVWRAYSPTIWWKIPGIYFGRMTSAEAGTLYNAVIISKWDIHLTQICLGFTVVAVLSLLQPRLSILRSLSIGGLVFGAWAGYTVWVPWLIALIVKYIIMKTAGIRVQEETVRPFSLGLIAGAILTLVTMQVGNFLEWLVLGTGR